MDPVLSVAVLSVVLGAVIAFVFCQKLSSQAKIRSPEHCETGAPLRSQKAVEASSV
ncbi:transducin beta-like protein 2-like protein [Corchorus capsularis]|uniref:Transducin beta-like protein 2-like protein n=1 Tax=Corchorus capsularis TaxID=210143 RepID=A0A1R3IZT0_COCAP|nr:transducin beta-like protein 2-like protein [Corchorus capsularis]